MRSDKSNLRKVEIKNGYMRVQIPTEIVKQLGLNKCQHVFADFKIVDYDKKIIQVKFICL